MRDPSRQGADGLHLLRPLQLYLQFLARLLGVLELRDVVADAEHLLEEAAVVVDRPIGPGDPHRFARAQRGFALSDHRTQRVAAHGRNELGQPPGAGPVGRKDEPVGLRSQQLRLTVAKQPLGKIVHIRDPALAIDAQNGAVGRFHQLAVLLFAFLDPFKRQGVDGAGGKLRRNTDQHAHVALLQGAFGFAVVDHQDAQGILFIKDRNANE